MQSKDTKKHPVKRDRPQPNHRMLVQDVTAGGRGNRQYEQQRHA